MIRPDIALDEPARLATLHSLNVLDTPPEERFDRVARMAKRIFGVPITLVSLVDDHRQWFKSCVGLGVTETSRDISFCGHAILGDDVLIVADATKDERFADNPLVLNDPHIRFYAGCPLSAPNGVKLGTLCIIDRQPRHFGTEDIEALKDLASMVERELSATRLATVDELTNLSNRRGFTLLAGQCLHLCARQNIPAALVFMDLDKFKQINDTFGHAEGDRALVAFAEELKKAFRDSDVIARLGGDEFAALLSNTSRDLAENLVARLVGSLKTYNQTAQRGYDVAFSHGVMEFDPAKKPTIEALLADGDARMYELKRAKE